MNYFHAVLLGLVQGATEILPISSSAHLFLVPWLLGWDYQGLAYDVALHWGTLLALVLVFWRDWLGFLSAAFSPRGGMEKRLFWGIFWATAPGAVAGLFLEDMVESVFQDPERIAWALMAFGALLAWADKKGRKAAGLESLGLGSCFLIGCAQALALAPGVSRSGITMTAGLLLGLRRDAAARFSFLLSMPIVVAAGALKLKDLEVGMLASGPFWVGFAVSAAAGYASVRMLLGWVKKSSLDVFALYRVGLGIFILSRLR